MTFACFTRKNITPFKHKDKHPDRRLLIARKCVHSRFRENMINRNETVLRKRWRIQLMKNLTKKNVGVSRLALGSEGRTCDQE